MPQENWRWCHKCQGLFYGGFPTTGSCPAGGGHENQGSGDYTLPVRQDNPPDSGQFNWRFCRLCFGLFFAGFPTTGWCPAPGAGGHDWTNSFDYSVHYGANQPGQQDWQWCYRCQGLFFAGNNTSGFCPAGGGHDWSKSQGYTVGQVSD